MTGTSIVRFFAAIGLAACGADANTSPTVGSTPPVIPVVKGPPGLTVIAEGSHTDTAGATLPNGLTVLVRDAEGLPMKGVGVQLDATTTGNPSAVEPLVFLADNSLFGTASYGAATRADGSLTVRVQFGKKAATVRARISVRSLGLADSVTYSILPASAFRIAVAPSDTLLMIGATLRPLVGVVDQFGNTRDDVVKMELVSGRTVRLDAAGGVVGVDYGRSELDATVSNRLLARIVVTVVPTGALAFFDNGFSAPAIMERFALDGSGYRIAHAGQHLPCDQRADGRTARVQVH